MGNLFGCKPTKQGGTKEYKEAAPDHSEEDAPVNKEESASPEAAPMHEEAQSNGQSPVKETTPVITHVKARTGKYPGSDVERFHVPDDKVPWTVEFQDYSPVEYTVPKILNDKPEWADPDTSDDAFEVIKFNEVDKNIRRISHMGKYDIFDGKPRNPVGRTGISGRGLLGKWGPNHAADPLVTRWKRNSDGEQLKHETDNKPILEFVSIQRRDNQEWAIPGGMVDNGEQVSLTLKREFGEEAMNSIEESERECTKKLIDELFTHGEVIYQGYVDDPRNTDNSWMETVAVNFHDDDGTTVGKIPLEAGDDAKAVRWLAVDKEVKLYASHMDFVKATCEKRGAYFPTL
ncbi:ADP-ribose pyrophosphatase, mitochondrial-like isoform X3 [Hydractinia symbiolongicarpus]|uniref:ADP-ribose pyrophosphatase, mitochondrial-like isoform X3 n=1 Tax=Hydractinia symbiolongicarpus TaxID=13093 RepID=UPI00254ADA61|nr:ADP-ribose pyrophosphatase, mitochondrial-like isoform X3 [Hydractinia symbiolongicarpus]